MIFWEQMYGRCTPPATYFIKRHRFSGNTRPALQSGTSARQDMMIEIAVSKQIDQIRETCLV